MRYPGFILLAILIGIGALHSYFVDYIFVSYFLTLIAGILTGGSFLLYVIEQGFLLSNDNEEYIDEE